MSRHERVVSNRVASGRATSWRAVPKVRKALQDEVKPERELGARGPGGLRKLHRVLRDVGELAPRARDERLRALREIGRGSIPRLPDREPDEMAVEDVIRVMRLGR